MKKFKVSFSYNDIKWLLKLLNSQYCETQWLREFDLLTDKQFDKFCNQWSKVYSKIMYINEHLDSGIQNDDVNYTYEDYMKDWNKTLKD